MQIYSDINHDSGVEAFELGPDYIDVKFRNTQRVYRYSYRSAGASNVEHMKDLAQLGNGLNSFINRCVKYDYEK